MNKEKIPYYNIKREIRRADEHNERLDEKKARHHHSERERMLVEIADASNSEAFKRDVKYDKRHPGYLNKTLRKIYGEKVIPHD